MKTGGRDRVLLLWLLAVLLTLGPLLVLAVLIP